MSNNDKDKAELQKTCAFNSCKEPVGVERDYCTKHRD